MELLGGCNGCQKLVCRRGEDQLEAAESNFIHILLTVSKVPSPPAQIHLDFCAIFFLTAIGPAEMGERTRNSYIRLAYRAMRPFFYTESLPIVFLFCNQYRFVVVA